MGRKGKVINGAKEMAQWLDGSIAQFNVRTKAQKLPH